LSLIADLGDKNKNLPNILGEYEAALEGYQEHLAIKGKNLEHANREHPAWQSYYDERRMELHTLYKHFETQMYKVRGSLFKQYTESYSRELNDRAKDQYINHEDEFLKISGIYLEVKDLHDRYVSVVDAFRSRGFALNNITKIRVAALEDAVI
jgi:hypothetical protein